MMNNNFYDKLSTSTNDKNAELLLLCEEKNDQLAQCKIELKKKDEKICKLMTELFLLKSQHEFLELHLNNINNSRSWRLARRICSVIDFIKNLPIKIRTLVSKIWGSHVDIPDYSIAKSLGLENKTLDDLDNLVDSSIIEKQKSHKFDVDIKFSIVVPVFNTPELFLKQMIQSVINQTYANWELCLADASDSDHSYVCDICKEFAQIDNRIKYLKLNQNIDISQNTNRAIEIASGDYVAFLDHDDVLHPCALFENMLAITKYNADFTYTDELTFEKDIDNIVVVHLKPDFAIDNLRANNYICHFTCVKKTLLDEVGLLDSGCNGSQDYDLVLRLSEKAKCIYHIRKVLYFWRSHSASVASTIDTKPYCITSAIKALNKHFERCNLNAAVIAHPEIKYGVYNVMYEIKGEPSVSIIIPNCDHAQDLKRCIDSILSKTSYENYEIVIVENNSKDEETFEYYKELEKKENIKILNYKGDFNFSDINNFAVEQVSSDYVLFLNNDTKVINSLWLENMLMQACRDEVGAVGAKLYFPDLRVQHAGVVLGLGGIAGHSHLFVHTTNFGYMARLKYTQNFSAVTAACMMVSRDKFLKIGGFDAENFKVAYNDVDLCLRLREAGYINVFTPFAELFHYESQSRGYDTSEEKQKRLEKESENFRQRWNKLLENGDPYYNPGFSLDASKSFDLDLKPYNCELPLKN